MWISPLPRRRVTQFADAQPTPSLHHMWKTLRRWAEKCLDVAAQEVVADRQEVCDLNSVRRGWHEEEEMTRFAADDDDDDELNLSLWSIFPLTLCPFPPASERPPSFCLESLPLSIPSFLSSHWPAPLKAVILSSTSVRVLLLALNSFSLSSSFHPCFLFPPFIYLLSACPLSLSPLFSLSVFSFVVVFALLRSTLIEFLDALLLSL